MSKCWYCNNELTSGDNPKHFGICNKCYDEMFKTADTIIRSFTNKITNLEAKLAELREQIAICDEENGKTFMQCFNAMRENVELKQQLAEKDKEIKELNACVKFYKSYYISFNEKVIGELEKVKSAFGLINSKLDKVETIKEYIHYIDHQINELKEMKQYD